MNQTINKERKIVYVALNFATGLSDLVLSVRKPDGTMVAPAPSVTEQGDGVYTFTYTPDISGKWQEKISSALNSDIVFRSFNAVAFDNDDLHSQADSIESKVDNVDADIAVVDGKVDAIDVKVDTVDGKVDTIDGKIDTIDGKVDASNVALSSIETKVDALDIQVTSGGYFA